MKKVLSLVLLVALMGTLFTGCKKDDQVVLNVYNWGDYIDEDIFDIFEEETGIKVNYETYATNEEMYTKIKKGGTQYDIAIPSDYMIEKMIKEDLVEPIDLTKIPNYANIDTRFKNLAFDPNNAYSVPYFWGTVGIIYNTNIITEPVDSWNVLWDEKYAGQFTMVDSQRDSIMVALKKLGYSMNTKSVAELEAARDVLIEQKPNVLAYVGDNVKDMLISEETAMAVVWSGEASTVIQEYDNFEYALPKEGSNIWFDNVVIPKGAKNIDAAHQFVDFLCRGDIGFKNADYVGYATCNTETMKLLDPALMGTTYAYPDDALLENFEIFSDPGDFITEYDRVWTELKAK
ncbi:spermidine/putrescine ABC transporter substrate-binding protein [Fusibacter bizertensis]|uniref:Spermidine/putrescine ABC transporter substrate-binding protein n=1 Tax=Fusibacter bizertensis TaxID=1488331 RepID=A0ABT6NES3_9FIRM|nr:spermidine/putrescine ABC transporter substrate-binding protein [Fusibacter bizertensis]MDH8678898.1 spermidine/putrescine ABC transporter substrate-binding protein [Fusibacter bizertensis]